MLNGAGKGSSQNSKLLHVMLQIIHQFRPGRRLAPFQFFIKLYFNPAILRAKTGLKLAAGNGATDFSKIFLSFSPIYVPCVSASRLHALPVPLPQLGHCSFVI